MTHIAKRRILAKRGKVAAKSRPRLMMPSQSMKERGANAIEIMLLALCGLALLVGGCAGSGVSNGGVGGSGPAGHASGGAGPTAGTGGSTLGTGGAALLATGGSTSSGGAMGSTGGSEAQPGGSHVETGGSATGTGGPGGATAGGTGGERSGDAGGSTGPSGAGGQVTSALCPATAVFCDDFEDGNLDGWVKMESGGTLAIDSTHASSGKNALSITMATGQRGGWLQRTGSPLFPLPKNAIYGRVMMYFESLPGGHTDFIRAAPTGGNAPWYNVGEQTGKVLLNYFGNGSDCWARPSPSTNIPLNTWMCWEFGYDGTKNQMQFYIDSQLSRMVDGVGDGCTGPNVWTAPTFNYLAIGAYNAQPTISPSVGKMWFDDVAVSTTGRVGCPAAMP